MKLPFVSRKKYDELVYKLECLLCHATGGYYSKAGYSLKDMCQMVDEHIDRCIENSELHGKWTWETGEKRCSVCGVKCPEDEYNYLHPQYCLSCGAKMD